ADRRAKLVRGHGDKIVLLPFTSTGGGNILGNNQSAADVASFVQRGCGHYTMLLVAAVAPCDNQFAGDCVRSTPRPTGNRQVRGERFAPWKLERERAADDLPV